MSSTASSDRGSALIVVLSVLMICAVLTLSAVTVSKLIFSVAYVAAGRSEAAYAAEGAAARYQWLLMYDIKNHSNRELAADDDGIGADALAGADAERVMADMKPHQMDYYGLKVTVQLDNMIKQADLSSDAASAIRSVWGPQYEELEEYEDFLEFVDCVKDYTDRDDVRGLKGAEAPDYELANLPRNDKLQYREEMLMVKNAPLFIKPDAEGRLSQFTVIPPLGMPAINKGSNSKPSFFSATRSDLSSAGFEADEIEALIAARQAFFDSGASFGAGLDPGLLSRVKGKFSFRESEYYTFKIVAGNKVKRTLYLSLKTSSRMANNGNEYFEWCLY